MEAARHLVPAAPELPARVENGMDDLERVLAGRVLPDGHAPAVVHHRDHPVRRDPDVDVLRVPALRPVDGVAAAPPDGGGEPPFVGGADVHARPSANRLEAFEDLDAGGVVIRATASFGSPR